MTREEKLIIMNNRYAVLANRGDKNIKAPGVLKKLKRKINNMGK